VLLTRRSARETDINGRFFSYTTPEELCDGEARGYTLLWQSTI
jgi:hypothetical protein